MFLHFVLPIIKKASFEFVADHTVLEDHILLNTVHVILIMMINIIDMEAKDVTQDTIVLLCLAAGGILEIGYGIVIKFISILLFFNFVIFNFNCI